MTRLRAILTAGLLATVIAGNALAQTYEAHHDPSNDRYVGTDGRGPGKAVLPKETVERITFDVMPVIHQRVANNTKRNVTYSYVIVQVGDESMAVDPFRFNR